jgi:hypothetical protein
VAAGRTNARDHNDHGRHQPSNDRRCACVTSG